MIANSKDQVLLEVNNRERSIAPTGFEENKGQVRTTVGESARFVRYRLTQGTTSIFLLSDGIAYQFNRLHYPEGYMELERDRMYDPKKQEQLRALRAQVRLETYRMDMVLEGADTDPLITTEERSADHTNYYNYDALAVHSYARIIYHDVYPGIDWILYTTVQGLKYDFVVHPGADPAEIRLRFKHHEELHLDDENRLTYGNRMGRFTEEAPVSFQDGLKIPTHFDLEGDLLHFTLESYDRSRSLTIDPSLIWGTYYGGEGWDQHTSCAVDASGNVYLTGTTSSPTGIADAGHQNASSSLWDAFMVKFNPAGNRIWGTYYGGEGGVTAGLCCAADAAGNAYLAGETEASTGIAMGGHQNNSGGGLDAFLVKFDPTGVRLWGTYYGGAGLNEGLSCAVDANGNVFLAGRTDSPADIASNGYQDTLIGGYDGFLVKFDPGGTRLWGTYYGGTSDEMVHSCAIDPSGNVYMAGTTGSSSNIADGGQQDSLGGGDDAFLVKFDPLGSRQWATYYGGTELELGYACASDLSGNVYLAGSTKSSSGIANAGHQNSIDSLWDAFLVKFDPDGTRLWGTYYGGSADDLGHSCAVNLDENVYLTGGTWSTSGIADDGYQNALNGDEDAFLVKFDPAGTRLWGTYYGGSSYDVGSSCAVDLAGNVFLAGVTMSLSGIASGGHQNTHGGGGNDSFLVKFDGSISTVIVDVPSLQLAAFPNPTGGLLEITTSVIGQRYAITDPVGRMLTQGRLLTRTGQIDLSAAPAGMYLLQVWGQEGTKVIRVVKE